MLLTCLVVGASLPGAAFALGGAAPTADGADRVGSAPAAQVGANGTTLTVLAYNDIQTAMASDTGEMARLAGLIDERRAAHDNPTVLAGGGDEISPHALSPVSAWQLPVEVLNVVDPAAEAVGNHDLDYGDEAFANASAASEFPWLAANLVNESTGEPIQGANGTYVVERDGVRVGFVGLVDEAIIGKTALDFDEAGIEVRDFAEVGPERAEYLKEERNVDVVVSLAHIGVPESEELAEADDGAIDLIVTGDDELVYPPQETSGTTIVEAGSEASHLAEVNLTLSDGDVTAVDGRLIETTEEVEPNESVQRLIQEARETGLEEVIGESTTELNATSAANYHRETALGNAITDAFRAETGSQVAITNSGGIRSNRVYPAGNVTVGDATTILPFTNTLVTFRLNGSELREVLASQVVTLSSEEGQQYGTEITHQVSGVRFEWVPHEGVEPKVRDVYVDQAGPDEPANWTRLDAEENYTVTVNSYMAGGGDGYPLENATRVSESGILYSTAFINYVEERGTISPKVEGRMRRVDAGVGNASVSLDGDSETVTATYAAPANATAVNASSFYALDADGERVAATDATLADGEVTVTFDADDLSAVADAADLNVYGEYTDSYYDGERVYWGASVLSGELDVTTADEPMEPEATYYQVDFVAGEPLENLSADTLYANDEQDRLVRFAHGDTSEGITDRGRAWASEEVRSCVDSAGVIDREGETATITFTVNESCENATMSLVSYTKPTAGFSPETADQQELFDATTETFEPGTHTITVSLPDSDAADAEARLTAGAVPVAAPA
ncbi:UDP-sugar hydrolase / 5'-nucleotidase [Candidatus Halobonum tyrrellensis G22]|uniref:UDP-sugar hydrolase / 5'-nucleotidase n=1 Tax=Candidatus Halobonum tyrrellensis G22 TaxID=1324957 RepID=V4IY85_9EURY|nr:UDP-sugar hydrolase / 5'-nucleotidase [Candidatus Halobonum tyrrellensis G22]